VTLSTAAIVVMIVIAAVLGPERLVAGDGHYVFAVGRSLAYDGDLDLTNQYLIMGDRWGLGRDPATDGWRLPPREIGSGLVMVLGLWLHLAVDAGPASEPVFACLGAAASLGLTWLGCVCAIEASGLGLARARVERIAGAAVFGFVVPYYAFAASGYTHAIDAMVCAWLAWALLARKPAVVVGGLLACAVLTRLQNLLWLLWPLVEVWTKPGHDRQRDRLTRLLGITAIGLLGLAPQIMLGLLHPGSARGSFGWTPEFFDLVDLPRDLVRVLVGVHGLVRWTPVAALALIGLGLRSQQAPLPRPWPAYVLLGALWLLLACVRDVDGGDAFGARRLAGVVGLLAVGLARFDAIALTSSGRRTLAAIVLAALVSVNLAMTGLAVAGRVSLASPGAVRGHR
jgi:hypothetical protein